MSEKQNVPKLEGSDAAIARAKDLWSKNNKMIIIVCSVIILLGGGWLVYKNFVKAPKEKNGMEAMFKAEEYFRADSLKLALNGDGQYDGFLKVISKYSGTPAANLAHYYAGVCYVRMDDNANAVKQLEKFSSSATQIQQRAYKLLGDAYADMGKNSDALANYKKAAREFEEDRASSSDALYSAAYFAEKVMKDSKEAIALYKELKEKFPAEKGYEADLHLGSLGVYNAN